LPNGNIAKAELEQKVEIKKSSDLETILSNFQLPESKMC
jgi:hypothetical protein